MDSSNLTGGFKVQTQIPLDVKQYSQSEESLSNLGTGNNLAYTYTQGLVVYCIEEGTRWEWKKVPVGQENTGLLSQDFIYPNGLITFGIDYSLKRFNFFPYVTNGQIGPQGLPGENGLSGPQGLTGPRGLQGLQGIQGIPGLNGANGLSAYEIALSEGFVGSEIEWLLSLIGPQGPEGPSTDLSLLNLQTVLNNSPSSATINTDLIIDAENFQFNSNASFLKILNHLVSSTGENNLIISTSNTPSGLTNGKNNVIIGNPVGLPGGTSNNVIITDANSNIVFQKGVSGISVLPLQTIFGIESSGSGKVIATREYVQSNKALKYIQKSNNYLVLISDGTIDCIANTFTVTLPTLSVEDTAKEFVIKNSGTGIITINTQGGELIDGTNTIVLNTQYDKIRVQFTGSKYIII